MEWTLFWMSLDLRKDIKNVVHFPSGKLVLVGRVVALHMVDGVVAFFWVSLVLMETDGPIPSVEIGAVV